MREKPFKVVSGPVEEPKSTESSKIAEFDGPLYPNDLNAIPMTKQDTENARNTIVEAKRRQTLESAIRATGSNIVPIRENIIPPDESARQALRTKGDSTKIDYIPPGTEVSKPPTLRERLRNMLTNKK